MKTSFLLLYDALMMNAAEKNGFIRAVYRKIRLLTIKNTNDEKQDFNFRIFACL